MKERLRRILEFYGFREDIVEAFTSVPRERFTERSYPESIVYSDSVIVTYDDGKTYSTSSQPSLMASFMDWAGIKRGSRVLEIGGGTGYNASVMGKLVGEEGYVVSIEYEEKVCEIGKRNIENLGYKNVLIVCGDGYYGFSDKAPYDAILCTVGIDEIPRSWFKQLVNGGRIVAPLNVHITGRQPAFVFVKREEELLGVYKTETRFIMAGGRLGNLWERNREKLSRLEGLEETGTLEIPFFKETSFLELLELLTGRLTRDRGKYHYVGEEGFAVLEGRIWRVFGKVEELYHLFNEWKNHNFPGFERIQIVLSFRTPPKRFFLKVTNLW